MTNQSDIIEIFSSVQGEGPYLGFRQIFVRFPSCNLACNYCDTQIKADNFCRVEILPGSENFKEIDNPVNIDVLVQEINILNSFPHHSISLTGGEPLLSVDFLSDFLAQFNNNNNLKIYLETNGTLHDKLERIIDKLDIISMDFKLESSSGCLTDWDKHKEFIKIAQKYNKEIFSKIVVTNKITQDEINQITNIVKNLNSDIPVILQPVSSQDRQIIPSPELLFNLQSNLLRFLPDVRVIPQVHRYLDIL